MLFLNYMQFDTSIIIIVSKYQEKKMTATDFVMVFVRNTRLYVPISAYYCLCLPIFSGFDVSNLIFLQ